MRAGLAKLEHDLAKEKIKNLKFLGLRRKVCQWFGHREVKLPWYHKTAPSYFEEDPLADNGEILRMSKQETVCTRCGHTRAHVDCKVIWAYCRGGEAPSMPDEWWGEDKEKYKWEP